MTYVDAIHICDTIYADSWDENTKLLAIEKILSMATINAVRKDTLLKVIRWFFDNCVELKTPEEDIDNGRNNQQDSF